MTGLSVEEECRITFIPALRKEYENYTEGNKEKKIEKEFRKKMLEATTIRNENIIFAALNDIVFRFLMLFEEGYEDWVPCRNEEKEMMLLRIKNSRKNLKFSYIKLKKNANTLENIIKEVNEKLISTNDNKVMERVADVTLKEMNSVIVDEKIVVYINSTQDQEIEFIQKLWITSKLITNLLPKAVFSENEIENENKKQSVRKLVDTLELLKEDWREYAKNQTLNSKEALVRKLLKEEEVLDLKKFKEKEIEYLEKFTEKELKNKIKSTKCKKTKELNILRDKNKKINDMLTRTRENFKHEEADMQDYENTLKSLNSKLLNREYDSFDELCEVYGEKTLKN